MQKEEQKISKEQILKVAKLSYLKFSESELEKITNQIHQILDYVDMIDSLDTENVQPTVHTIELNNVYRKDEILPNLEQKTVLQLSPKSDENYIIVPKVIN